MKKPRAPEPKWIEVQGNHGGSFILLTETTEGMVHLEIGETCVRTVDCDISVCALAIILTVAKDRGFQSIVDEYLASTGGRGSPEVRVDRDIWPLATPVRE